MFLCFIKKERRNDDDDLNDVASNLNFKNEVGRHFRMQITLHKQTMDRSLVKSDKMFVPQLLKHFL